MSFCLFMTLLELMTALCCRCFLSFFATSTMASSPFAGTPRKKRHELVSCASAPGKVILFGEHSVVFAGQPAIAAALSLRIHVAVRATTTRRVHVSMPDLPTPLQVSFHAESLVNSTFKGPPTKENVAVIHEILLGAQPDIDEIALSALTPLVYLLNKLTSRIFPPGMEIIVRSKDLPVGAGLGSSAAFSVALVAALFGLSLHSCPIGKPSPRQLEVINQYAFYSEILLHGTPSGIDNAVSCYGKAIVYTKGDGNVSMDHLEIPPIDMILTNTHVPRSTKTLVAGVRAMYNAHTHVVQGILDSMGAIAREFREIIMGNDFEKSGDEIMTLVETNQHLLRALGVSHPSLDRICSVVNEVGCGNAATKLTGAGGGGCAMTLLCPDADPNLSSNIQAALKKASKQSPWNFSCLTSTVGGDGVLWTDPESFDETVASCTKQNMMRAASDEQERKDDKSYELPLAVAVCSAAAVAILATRVISR